MLCLDDLLFNIKFNLNIIIIINIIIFNIISFNIIIFNIINFNIIFLYNFNI